MKRYLVFLILTLLIPGHSISGQQITEITVAANKPVAEVQPTMWGVFFEDINFAADGGIYAELVKNRSFEFSLPLMGWNLVRQNGNGRTMASFYYPANPSNPRYMRVVVNAPSGVFGLENEGFRGMGIVKDAQYDLSLMARFNPNSDLKVKIELVAPKGEIIGESEISGLTANWKKFSASFMAKQTEPGAKLKILFSGTGTVDIDMVSLFPKDTWKGRPGGLRKDLAQLIADLKPGFVRFPGGCIVEGRDLTNRYQWKNTVGPVEQRKMIINRWNMEMGNRQAPDYFQSFGMGFYEYFLFAEDVGAEPLPILNCGMSCQFNAGEIVPLEELDPYIQDALDLIEFANGSAGSKWGKIRASMGHPEPFNLKYLGVGNEQWDEQYIERYREFEKVIKLKYPDIKIVSGSGPYASGDYFNFAWKELRKLSPALVDEHYYMAPEWFLKNAARYDNYDRTGPKIFAGEYAGHWKEGDEAESRNTWYSALAEAAFMTGLERNADIVNMASYAPLLAHVDAWQWRPDLIWFDNLKSIGTPNYYVQKIFSNCKGTNVIPVLSGGKPLTGQDSLYASGTLDKKSGKVFIKLVNSAKSPRTLTLNLEGLSFSKEGTLETLRSKELTDFNSINDPKSIYPYSKTIQITGKKLKAELEGISVNTLILTAKK
jgi:alpha-L-arabinofuranosidase